MVALHRLPRFACCTGRLVWIVSIVRMLIGGGTFLDRKVDIRVGFGTSWSTSLAVP